MAMLMLVSCWVFTPIVGAADSYSWSLTIVCVEDFWMLDDSFYINVTGEDGSVTSYVENDSRLSFTSSPDDKSSDWSTMFLPSDNITAVITGTSDSYPVLIEFGLAQRDDDSLVTLTVSASVGTQTASAVTKDGGGSAGDKMDFSFSFVNEVSLEEYDWSVTITCVDDFYASGMTITVTTVNGDVETYSANDSSLTFSSSPSDFSSNWLGMFEKGTDQTAVISGTSIGYPETIDISITQTYDDSTVGVYAKATVDSISVAQQYGTTTGYAGDVIDFNFDFSLYVPSDDLSEDYVGTGYDWSIPITCTSDFFADDIIVTVVDVLGNTTTYTQALGNLYYSGSESDWGKFFEWRDDTTRTFSGTSEYFPTSITFSVTSTNNNTDCMYNFTATVGTDVISYISSRVYVEDVTGVAGEVLSGTADMSAYNPYPSTHSVKATTANTTVSTNGLYAYDVSTNYVDNGEGQMDTSFVTVIFYDQYGQPIFDTVPSINSSSGVYTVSLYETYGPYNTYKITMNETDQAAGATDSITGTTVLRCAPSWGNGYNITLYTTVNDADYTYTYTTNEGTSSTVTTQTANYGTDVDFTDPTKANYEFQGMFDVKDDDFTDEATPEGATALGTSITSNTVWYASWEIDKFDLEYLDLSGTTLASFKMFYNYSIDAMNALDDYSYTIPTTTQDPDNDYHYTFSHWATESDTIINNATKITAETTVSPVFNAIPHIYSDDSWSTTTPATCSSNEIESTTCVTCGYEVTREVANTQLVHSYGYDADSSYEATLNTTGLEVYKCSVCGDTIETTIPALRAVTFDLGDGETLYFEISEGETLSAEQIAKLEEAAETVVNDYEEAGYTYTFNGWTITDGDTVYTADNISTYVVTDSESQTFTPNFTAKAEEYSLTYIIDSETVELNVSYGDNIHEALKDVNTDKDDTDSTIYTFSHWVITGAETEVTDTDTITANTSVTAVYDETTKSYTVTIDGTEYSVKYGEKLSADDVTYTTPTKDYDETYHYTFDTWVLEGTDTSIFDVEVTENIEAVASFTSVEHSYGDWIETVTATCTKVGSHYKVCSCGHTVTEEIPMLEHTYVETTVEATLNVAGSIKWICSVCYDVDESRTEIIPALRSVTFVDQDGDTLKSYTLSEGALITEFPTVVETYEDATYEYTFEGWRDSSGNLVDFATYTVLAQTTAQVFTASYSQDFITYTVTYVDELANHDEFNGNYDALVTLPTIDSPQTLNHKTYTFEYWEDESGTQYKAESFYLTADVKLTAIYDIVDVVYTVDFDDAYNAHDDETGIYDSTFNLPTPEDNPDAQAQEGYEITFQHWTDESGKTYEGGAVYTITGDQTLTAVYKEELITYTVKFVDNFGATIDELTVNMNASLSDYIPSNPTKEDSADYQSYNFTNWTIDDETFEDDYKVTADITVTANFESYYKTWTVTFVDANGETLQTVTDVQNGEKLTALVDAPSKDYDDNYHYTFNMWVVEGTELSAYDQNITSDTTIAPYYISTRHTVEYVVDLATEGVAGSHGWYCTGCGYCYDVEELPALHTLTFYDEDKATVFSTIQKAEGTVIYTSSIETPVKSSVNGVVYTFSHWADKNGKEVNFDDGYTISEAASFYAVFSEATYYTVKFLDYNGNLLQAKMYKDGTVLTADDLPEDPTRASSGYVSYVFDGWDNNPIGETVTKELIFTATYSETVRMCTVTFVYADGSEAAESITAIAGTNVEMPSFDEYLENDDDTHYALDSYTNADKLVDISSDVEIVVNYVQEAHNFKVTTINATCENNKTYVYTCTDCGCTKTVEEENTLTGHTWVLKNTVSEDDGYYELYYCVYCGEEYKDYHYASDEVELALTFTFTDHTAVSGARVDIYKNSIFITSTYTDASGNATISLYVDGTYTATLTGEDFVTTSQTFTVEDGELTSTLTSITKADCTCTCHEDTFWGAIFRFFQKIGKLFTGKYGCCDCPSEMY